MERFKLSPQTQKQNEQMQKVLFDLGYEWSISEKTISNSCTPYLYAYDDGSICYGTSYQQFRDSTGEYATLEKSSDGEYFFLIKKTAHTIYGKQIKLHKIIDRKR